MGRMIIVYLVFFALFHFGLSGLYHASPARKLSLAKSLLYSTICAVLATLTLAVIVILF